MLNLRRLVAAVAVCCSSMAVQAQAPAALKAFVKEDAPVLALEHVRVIDGTGNVAQDDRTVIIDHGKIAWVGPTTTVRALPTGVKVLDLSGKSIFPGLVGMHEHLFYPLPDARPGLLPLYGEMADSAPRLYLAGGVTSARTAGSLETYTDISLKRAIDAGKIPGPRLFITGPYLEGDPAIGPQLHTLSGPEDAARMVTYWAAEGATSFKAYMHITAQELKAAIDTAHAHKLKVTGHLCAVGFKEAAALGIDNLEHGLPTDSEFYSDKKEGVCPDQNPTRSAVAALGVEGQQIQSTIKVLIAHHVAVTSTLAIFETFVPNRPPMSGEMRVRAAVVPEGWADYATRRAEIAEHGDTSLWPTLLKQEMLFEREFVKQGGLLMAGCDPTGFGGVLPGFGDQRNIELLVEAGFTPEAAIHIAYGRRRQGCRPGGGGRESCRTDCRCREGRNRIQRWRGLRPAQPDRIGARPHGNSLNRALGQAARLMSGIARFFRFPLAGIDAMCAATSRSFPRHTHDQYGIGVLDRGGHASLSDRGQVEAGSGDLIFVNPGEVHDGRPIGGRPRSWRMLYVDPAVMEATRADIHEKVQACFAFAAPVFADERLRRLFDAAFTHAIGTGKFSEEMACETAILRMIARIEINSTSRPRTRTHLTAPIRRARDKIDADPSAPLTLRELAGEVGISRFQLLRAFAHELGLTPHAYIVQQRLALARRLIRAGESLAESAMAAGFCDQSHFTRSFVRQFGVTPARYAARG
jgi:AraC-like DNA-binding protein/imidazolonepropionase-like amidohydrolase